MYMYDLCIYLCIIYVCIYQSSMYLLYLHTYLSINQQIWCHNLDLECPQNSCVHVLVPLMVLLGDGTNFKKCNTEQNKTFFYQVGFFLVFYKQQEAITGKPEVSDQVRGQLCYHECA